MAIPQSSPITSQTLNPSGGEVDYDQTIKIKTPGSGMMVFNRYKLERVLGRGGMGVVWLADDMKLERPVALKFLPSLIGLDPAAVKELKTETRRGLELSHPHIVRIYDFVDDEDAAAISMEFVDGKTLSELRMGTEAGVFSVEEISQWLLGVCDALDYAHFQRKLIHRDLKPANIMLTTRESVAKIADFGIARSLSDTMSRLSVANLGTSGTLPYMSPQQAMGERPQPTDDVYSLGATIYELLSGKPPFYRGDLPTQINSKIPPSVYERRQELEITSKEAVPKLWEEAIAACLHKEPSMRPSCAGVLAEMLGLKPATVSIRTGTYAVPTARTVSEKAGNRAPLIAAAAAVVVGAGASAWFLMSAPPQDEMPPKQAGTTANAPAVAESAPKSEPVTAMLADADAKKTVPESPIEIAPVTETELQTAPAAPAAVGAATTAPAIAEAGLGGLPLVPDPAGATPDALAAMNPVPPEELPPLPEGFEVPPTGLILTQPDVPQPETGFWTLEQVFPVIPHANYSAKGKRYLLYRTQSALKEKGLYTSTLDGAEGKGTHNAIVLFQVRSGLKANGMLDLPTLAALNLSAEPDKNDWAPASSGGTGTGSSRKRTPAKEEGGFLQKTGDTFKRLNPFGK